MSYQSIAVGAHLVVVEGFDVHGVEVELKPRANKPIAIPLHGIVRIKTDGMVIDINDSVSTVTVKEI